MIKKHEALLNRLEKYNEKGMQMYCDIMSFVETVKRKKLNIFQSIAALIKSTPAILFKNT